MLDSFTACHENKEKTNDPLDEMRIDYHYRNDWISDKDVGEKLDDLRDYVDCKIQHENGVVVDCAFHAVTICSIGM